MRAIDIYLRCLEMTYAIYQTKTRKDRRKIEAMPPGLKGIEEAYHSWRVTEQLTDEERRAGLTVDSIHKAFSHLLAADALRWAQQAHQDDDDEDDMILCPDCFCIAVDRAYWFHDFLADEKKYRPALADQIHEAFLKSERVRSNLPLMFPRAGPADTGRRRRATDDEAQRLLDEARLRLARTRSRGLRR